jgi:glutaconate CoA-transferase subunit A
VAPYVRPYNARALKTVSLAEAAAVVEDGDVVAIGGSLYSRTPWAMLLELLRAGRRDLTLTRSLMCYEAELFLARGATTKLVTSWVGTTLQWGLPPIFREYVESGRAVYEEWSHLALGLRFHAAAMGVPFLPTRSLLGSDLLAASGARELECPFTGERLALVPALVPDVALIHVHRADAKGNAQVDGPPYMDPELATAARKVVVTTERLVPQEEIVATADRTVIPHFVVDAVAEVPFGSFPHECYGLYGVWFDHLAAYARRVREEGVAGAEAYLREVVDDPGSFEAFLERVGPDVLAGCRRDAAAFVR